MIILFWGEKQYLVGTKRFFSQWMEEIDPHCPLLDCVPGGS